MPIKEKLIHFNGINQIQGFFFFNHFNNIKKKTFTSYYFRLLSAGSDFIINIYCTNKA